MKASTALLEWLKQRQSEHGWSNSEMTRHLSVSQATVSRILSGQVAFLSDRTVSGLCSVFRVDRQFLPSLSEGKTPPIVAKEGRAPYGDDEVGRLVEWLSTQPQEDQDMIINLARRIDPEFWKDIPDD